jgi:hypothetical protein
VRTQRFKSKCLWKSKSVNDNFIQEAVYNNGTFRGVLATYVSKEKL